MARKTKKRVVIIGNSAAGLSAIEAFRKRDKDSELTLIDREPYMAYSRVITVYFIQGTVRDEDNLFLRTKDYYEERGVKMLLGSEVLSVDLPSRNVVLDNGDKEPFDLLLVATGGSAQRPRIDGADPEDLLVLRNLEDARTLKEMKAKAWKGVFLGAGLVSLQTLQALFKAKGQYTMVVKSGHIMSQTLDPEASAIVERHLSKMGVRFRKGRDLVGLKKERDGKVAILGNGEEIETDFVFAGKGVSPNIQFLRGTEVETKKGVVVNRYLETNVEGVYAAGDVAEVPDFFSGGNVNYGLWTSAVEQGEVAGKNLAGLRESYPGNLKMNVTRLFAIPIVSIGDVASSRVAETLVRKDEKRDVYRRICLDEKGVIIGAVLINQVEDLGVLQGLIRERKSAEALKSKSAWMSPVRYGFVYKNILHGRI